MLLQLFSNIVSLFNWQYKAKLIGYTYVYYEASDNIQIDSTPNNHIFGGCWDDFGAENVNIHLFHSPQFHGYGVLDFNLDLFVCPCCGSFTATQYQAHAAVAYCVYIRQQSSDNSDTRWHDLLIRRMPIWIPCTNFGMEMLELHQGTTRVDIQIEGNPACTSMCLQPYVVVCVFMLPAMTSDMQTKCLVL
jgi:hypothetical protein